MLTSSGPRCDICNNHIFGLLDKDMVYTFSIDGKNNLMYCYKCLKYVQSMHDNGVWNTDLPEGRLKRMLEDYKKQMEENTK